MKKTFLAAVWLLFFFHTKAQHAVPPTVQRIMGIEADIKDYASAVINAESVMDRFRADSLFTRGLVQALRVPYSFSYPFDSLNTISRIYAPDSSFRIFTWQIMKDESYYRQKGAIQMNTPDGSLKIFPLFDFSEFTEAPVDSVRTAANWIGAVYYNIIQKEYNKKKYYTLLGYDENDASSTKKWIEVLTFGTDGKPQFGGRYFSYADDPVKPKQPAFRFCLQFKKAANAKMNYDPDMDMIILAHLISESGKLEDKSTLIPYGTYEGFKWIGGRWVHQQNITEADPRPSVNPPQPPSRRRNGN